VVTAVVLMFVSVLRAFDVIENASAAFLNATTRTRHNR